jgi:PAT family beta-lactamase induction signal transducer AmpG
MVKKGFWHAFLTKKMMIVFLMGFSSGLPFIMIGSTLKAWMARENIAISTITFFGITSIFYSWKFVWAPFMDRYSLTPLGRRRSWMLLSQIIIMTLLAVLSSLSPQTSLYTMGIICACLGFWGATQDIAIDAYRREFLKDEELGLASSIVQYGFRTAMLVGGGLGIWMVSPKTLNMTWQQLYTMASCLMIVGILTTIFSKEPEASKTAPIKTLREAVIEPFQEFLKRNGAVYILLFVFLYKLGDAMAGATLNPFYVQMGYSNESIGLIAKTYGLISSLVGLFLGGVSIFYIGIYRSLWVFGIMQAFSTASFAIITYTGPQDWALALAVLGEDLCTGMASAAFVAFISIVCNRSYTATQFALLSSVATSGRNIFSIFSGSMVEKMGWAPFFYFCAFVAIPGMLILVKMKKFIEPSPELSK